ncbi:MAG: hypothetical protein U0Z75_09010 [Deinococcaceae bacterium]
MSQRDLIKKDEFGLLDGSRFADQVDDRVIQIVHSLVLAGAWVPTFGCNWSGDTSALLGK